MYSADKKINDFLSDIEALSEQQFSILISLRTLFLDSNTALVEEFKYGGLTFNLAGGLIGGLYVYKKHISVEFSHGANFSDADLLLEGGGKKRRHLKITSYDDIHIKNTKYYIQQAIN